MGSIHKDFSSNMNLFSVTCLIITAVLYKAEGCCTPDQWEGQIGEIGGVARRSFYGLPHLIGGLIALSYDATNEKVASTTYMKGTAVKTIADYSAHKMYLVRNTTCVYYNLTKPFRKFCTDNATATGTAVYGGGAATLLANTWSFHAMGFQGYASTTQDDCVPIGETLYGKVKRDYIILTVGYFNITTGIKDPCIFDPPAGCQPGSGDIESHLDNLDVSGGVKYIVNKFHGEEKPKLKDKYLRYEEKFQSLNDI